MHVGAFFKQVCWNGTWQKVWFFGTAILTILVSFPQIGALVPWYVRYILPAGVFVLGFLISVVYTYSRIFDERDQIKERLQGVVVNIAKVSPKEHVCPIDTEDWVAHHHITIDFDLTLHNRDTSATTVSIKDCTLNVPGAVRKDLKFFGVSQSPVEDPPGLLRNVPAGVTRPAKGLALFALPVSEFHIQATSVSGTIMFSDTRENTYEKDFSEELIKNPIIREATKEPVMVKVRRSVWLDGLKG
jgi:hypothetical protein